MPIKTILLLLLLYALVLQNALAQVIITSEVSRKTLSLGGTLEYSITLSSSNERIDMSQFKIVKPPAFNGLELDSPSPTRSSQQQITNSGSLEVQKLIWHLHAAQDGTATIGETTVIYRGKTHHLSAHEIQVFRNQPPPSDADTSMEGILPAQSGDASLDSQLRNRVFARMLLSNPNPYLQEAVVATCKIFFDPRLAGSISNLGWHTPQWKDVFAQEVKQAVDGRLQTEIIGGKEFHTITIKQFLLAPTRTGVLEIPMQFGEGAVRVESRPTFEDSFFGDSFFGSSLFSRSVGVRLPIAPIQIKVKPLPLEGRPDSFQNAVGRFDFAASADRSEMTMDDILTLRFEIGGEGYLGSIQQPTLPSLPGWSIIGRQERIEGSDSAKTFRGKKVFEILLRPERTGNLSIGKIAFAFFDPALGRYVEKTAGPFAATVAQGAANALIIAAGPSKEVHQTGQAMQDRQQSAHLEYIKTGFPKLALPRANYKEPTLLACLAAPLLLVGFAGTLNIARRHREKYHADFFSKSARARARKELQSTRVALVKEDSTIFYRKVEEALRGFLAAKMGRPSSGLTLDEIASACTRANIPPEQITQLTKTLEKCELARYTPMKSSKGEMAKFLESTANLLDTLDKHFD